MVFLHVDALHNDCVALLRVNGVDGANAAILLTMFCLGLLSMLLLVGIDCLIWMLMMNELRMGCDGESSMVRLSIDIDKNRDEKPLATVCFGEIGDGILSSSNIYTRVDRFKKVIEIPRKENVF